MNQGVSLSSRMKSILIGLLVASPAICFAIVFYICLVNVPHMDEWDLGFVLLKARQGTLGFADIVAQHNEHRLCVSQLIMLALGIPTHWNPIYQSWVSFIFSVVSLIGVLKLAFMTATPSQTRGWILFRVFLANALLFGPIQYEGWMVGAQCGVYVMNACIVFSSIVILSRIAAWKKAGILAFLGTVSTWSFANGMELWGLSALLLLIADWDEVWAHKGVYVLWALAFVLNVGSYLHGYVKPAGHPALQDAIHHPFQALNYLLIYLGSPLGNGHESHDLRYSRLFGVGLVGVFLFCAGYTVWHRKDRVLLKSMSAWLLMGAYSLGCAVITTVGRMSFGEVQALSSRYVTFSMYLIIALIFTVPLALDHLSARWSPITSVWSARILTCLTTILILGHTISNVAGLGALRFISKQRLYVRACLMCANDVLDPDLILTYPDVNAARERVLSYDEAGFFVPRVLKGDIRPLKTNDVANENLGVFETFTKTGPDHYLAKGWALSTNGRSPAGGVVLTWTKADGAEVPLSVAWAKDRRDDIASKLPLLGRGCGWSKEFNTALPAGTVLHAWTLDPEKGLAARLAGEQTIK